MLGLSLDISPTMPTVSLTDFLRSPTSCSTPARTDNSLDMLEESQLIDWAVNLDDYSYSFFILV